MPLARLSATSSAFPSPEQALKEPNGLLAIGGSLSIARLLSAYHQGIFPWFSPGDPLLWWSPDPRAVLWPEEFHLSRSMRRFRRNSPYQVTLNQAFDRVIVSCADRPDDGTWITPSIIEAYCRLHHSGYAHSVEVWYNGELVGGLYGVAVGAVFCGESMFSRRENGSKIALYAFCQHFHSHGGKLIDCQILNDHTASLGARNIPRADYLTFLSALQEETLPANCWKEQQLMQ